MILFLLLFSPLYYCIFYGEVIHQEDRVFLNDSYTYYYDNLKIQHLKNKYVNPGELSKSNLRCKKDLDCQLDWCLSGSKCSKEGFCLLVFDYPCPHTMRCNADKRICENITCYTRYQCTDYIFCNGFELCEDFICKRSKHPCLYGTCIEKQKNCSFPVKISKVLKSAQLIEEKPKLKQSDSTYFQQNITLGDREIMIKLSGDPLWDSNSLGFQVAFLVIVIVLFILIVGLCLFLVFKPCCCRKTK